MPVPNHVWHRFEYALRTAYSCCCCLVLFTYWPMSPLALYLGPMVAVTSSVLYLGQWQESAMKVVVGTMVGTLLGYIVGLCFPWPILFFVIMFISLMWTSQCSAWDRTYKVFASISIILEAFAPATSTSSFVPFMTSLKLVLTILIPTAIIGITLLLPVPAISLFEIRKQVIQLNKKIDNMLTLLVQGFCESDYLTLYLAEFDQVQVGIQEGTATLALLTRYSNSEKILFHGAQLIPPIMKLYLSGVDDINFELTALRSIIEQIKLNETHSVYVNFLRVPMINVIKEMCAVLKLVEEFIVSAPITPVYIPIVDSAYGLWHMVKNTEAFQKYCCSSCNCQGITASSSEGGVSNSSSCCSCCSGGDLSFCMGCCCCSPPRPVSYDALEEGREGATGTTDANDTENTPFEYVYQFKPLCAFINGTSSTTATSKKSQNNNNNNNNKSTSNNSHYNSNSNSSSDSDSDSKVPVESSVPTNEKNLEQPHSSTSSSSSSSEDESTSAVPGKHQLKHEHEKKEKVDTNSNSHNYETALRSSSLSSSSIKSKMATALKRLQVARDVLVSSQIEARSYYLTSVLLVPPSASSPPLRRRNHTISDDYDDDDKDDYDDCGVSRSMDSGCASSSDGNVKKGQQITTCLSAPLVAAEGANNNTVGVGIAATISGSGERSPARRSRGNSFAALMVAPPPSSSPSSSLTASASASFPAVSSTVASSKSLSLIVPRNPAATVRLNITRARSTSSPKSVNSAATNAGVDADTASIVVTTVLAQSAPAGGIAIAAPMYPQQQQHRQSPKFTSLRKRRTRTMSSGGDSAGTTAEFADRFDMDTYGPAIPAFLSDSPRTMRSEAKDFINNTSGNREKIDDESKLPNIHENNEYYLKYASSSSGAAAAAPGKGNLELDDEETLFRERYARHDAADRSFAYRKSLALDHDRLMKQEQKYNMRREFRHLGYQNISARGAFTHRVAYVSECFARLGEEVLQANPVPWSATAFWVSSYRATAAYAKDCAEEMRTFSRIICMILTYCFCCCCCCYCSSSCKSSCCSNCNSSCHSSADGCSSDSTLAVADDPRDSGDYEENIGRKGGEAEDCNNTQSTHSSSSSHQLQGVYQELSTLISRYTQSGKISGAILITALIVRFFDLKNGLWAVLVIALIRQDTISSSFLMGAQRLEGTVVGAVYAFGAFNMFGCGISPTTDDGADGSQDDADTLACGPSVYLPVLVTWVLLCSFFREGKHHGYAAVVAGFTPIILFLSPSTGLLGAWRRIQQTFIGVSVYLLVDNLIKPRRIYGYIKSSVLDSILASKVLMCQSALALEELLVLEDEQLEDEEEEEEDGDGAASSSRSRREDEVSGGGSSGDNRRKGRFATASPSSSAAPPAALNEDKKIQKICGRKDVFASSAKHVYFATKQLDLLQKAINIQNDQLKFVEFEPELWYRLFPVKAYETLLKTLMSVYSCGRSACNAITSLSGVIQNMTRNSNHNGNYNGNYNLSSSRAEEEGVERREGVDVEQHLILMKYMASHLFLISSKSTTALVSAHAAIKQVYERGAVDAAELTDITALLMLSRSAEVLLTEVEDHFKHNYMRTDLNTLLSLDPYFILAWTNTFESLCGLVRTLSSLGMALHAVRNIEVAASLKLKKQ